MTNPSYLDRLRRFDPAVLPILIAGLVLVGAVAWLISRPLPAPAPSADARLGEQVATLRAEQAAAQRAEQERQAGLERRIAGLEGTAARIAALEARPAPDLAPLREAVAAAAGRAEAAERAAAAAAQRDATLEERLSGLARDLAARPAVDPAALAPRSALDQLSGRLDRLAERLETAAREQQARDAQEAARIEQIGRDAAARQAAMEQAQIALGQRIGAADAALAARAGAADAQAARIAALETGLAGRIAAVEQQVAQRAAALEQQLGQRGAAIEQQAARIAALEGAAQRLAALEGRSARMATVDALRAALEAGRPLGPQLATLNNPPEPLTRFATAAPPTEAALRLAFEEAARAGRLASEPARDGQGVLDSAVSRLSGLVTVRRGEEVVWGDAAAAEIERARRAVEAGDLEGALRFLTRLPPAAREAMRGWTSQAEALIAARAALRQLVAG
ncbi:hypothetical protein [Falsiroseomonas sp. CW058]|uniref:hypothetical protein n=1 Tax=Falsiroseomonas sp. CW058 TaxID=3388664 RepID=UPI003D3195CB